MCVYVNVIHRRRRRVAFHSQSAVLLLLLLALDSRTLTVEVVQFCFCRSTESYGANRREAFSFFLSTLVELVIIIVVVVDLS